MGKLIFGINLTIDGCCDHTRGNANDDVHDYFTDLTRDAGVLLYGRKTYELMVPFWPDYAKSHTGPADAMSNFADAFVAIPRIVVCSRTLESVNSENTTIIQSDLREQVLKLKQEESGNILTGGVDIPSQLIQMGLVDEFHIVIHPVFAGAGRRLADNIDMPEDLGLNLEASRVFPSGHVALIYAAS